jgi:DNA (cytosine-5)-methyltransferase 1
MDARLQNKSFVEFFAGIGLMREGLRDSGWQCLYANDIDPKKAQIYQARFGDSHDFHLGDVWDTDEVLSRLPVQPFLATASFPCTDLSLAGHWRGLDGEHSSAFYGFSRVIEQLEDRRPRMILIENVAGFLTSRGGADFASALTLLADLGYWIDAFVLDAKYFVPQSRPRVFIVGSDETVILSRRSQRGQTTLFGNERGPELCKGPLRPKRLLALMQSIELRTGWLNLSLPTPVEARDSLRSLIDVDDKQEWWDDAAVTKHYEMMSDRHRTLVDELLSGRGLHVGTIYRRKRYGKTRAEVRFDGLAGCLRTPRGGSARQIVIVVNKGCLKLRWMSPVEYGRLQGAGDYPILENVNQMLYGFGDAVCVPAVKWIDEHVLTPAYEQLRKPRTRGASVAG